MHICSLCYNNYNFASHHTMRECPLASVSDGNDVIEEMNEKLEAPIFLDSAIGMLLYCCCCCFHLHPHISTQSFNLLLYQVKKT